MSVLMFGFSAAWIIPAFVSAGIPAGDVMSAFFNRCHAWFVAAQSLTAAVTPEAVGALVAEAVPGDEVRGQVVECVVATGKLQVDKEQLFSFIRPAVAVVAASVRIVADTRGLSLPKALDEVGSAVAPDWGWE